MKGDEKRYLSVLIDTQLCCVHCVPPRLVPGEGAGGGTAAHGGERARRVYEGSANDDAVVRPGHAGGSLLRLLPLLLVLQSHVGVPEVSIERPLGVT